MTERPILFSAPMVLALRGGRKTQTRRTRGLDKINAKPERWILVNDCGHPGADGMFKFTDRLAQYEDLRIRCPYGVAGDQLWTRESFARSTDDDITYRATVNEADYPKDFRWRSSIHMPRWASRDTPEVISARPERLHAITEADAIAEGFGPRSATALFRGTWSVINGPDSWAKNPWIWRVEFKRLEAR